MSSSDDDSTLILRRSLEMRCILTRSAFLGVTLVTVVAVFNLISLIPIAHIAIWALPLLLAQAIRDTFSQYVLRKVNAPDTGLGQLRRWDLIFRLSSMANQFIAGSPVWFVSLHGGTESALFMTLVSGLYAVGATTNLASDPRTVFWSIPLVMGHLVVFWLGQADYGWTVVATLLIVTVLMVHFARRHGRIFSENVLIARRMDTALKEKDAALIQKEEALREKDAALAAADRARAEVEQAMKAKSLFLAAASHDLRQPLYALSLLSGTLAYETMSTNARRIVAQQQRVMDALKLLFDNLLDLSRFESGDMEPPSLAPVALRSVLRQMDAEFSSQCSARGLTWTLRDCDSIVITDQVMLVRMLRNLLWNAVRYTSKGYVELGAAQEGDRLRLWVNDSGPGIPEEDQERVFQEFVQLDRDRTRRESGVGLGLAIVRHIREALDIPMFLRSSEESGTRFTMILPARPAARQTHEPDALQASLPLLPTRLRKAKIWIVEDDSAVRTALDLHMRTVGVDCWIAASAEEYLAELSSGALPDAVIFDDMLGNGASGFELALDLISNHPEVPTLITTASSDSSRLGKIRSHGMTLLPKPASADDIIEWLQTALAD